MKDNRTWVHAYFRIEAGYVWGQGMDPAKSERFKNEIADLLKSVGFSKWRDHTSSPGYCPEGYRGHEYLYCHPMDLSGWILEESIPNLLGRMTNAHTFRVRTVDKFTPCKRCEDPAEFEAEVWPAWKKELHDNTLATFTTKRSNLFKAVDASDVERWVNLEVRGIVPEKDVEFRARELFWALFADMVMLGELVKILGKHGEMCRTAKVAQRKVTKEAA